MNELKNSGVVNLEKLIMSEDELRRSILGEFASCFLSEVQKIIDQYGKENFFNILRNDS